jgi:hypothetical protein
MRSQSASSRASSSAKVIASLLQALHEIEPQVGPVDALFAGEGVLRESLEMQARGLGMEQRVHFSAFGATLMR